VLLLRVSNLTFFLTLQAADCAKQTTVSVAEHGAVSLADKLGQLQLTPAPAQVVTRSRCVHVCTMSCYPNCMHAHINICGTFQPGRAGPAVCPTCSCKALDMQVVSLPS
jgi:hypothetical protein